MFLSKEAVNWWQDLEDNDYSWSGLESKRVRKYNTNSGFEVLTLKDIFSKEADRLIKAPNGKEYTQFHLPLYVNVDGDLVETDKKSWSKEKWYEVENQLKQSNWFRSVKQNKEKQYYWDNQIPSEDLENGPFTSVRLSEKVKLEGMVLNTIPYHNDGRDFFIDTANRVCFLKECVASDNANIFNYNNCLFNDCLDVGNSNYLNVYDCIVINSIFSVSNKNINVLKIKGGVVSKILIEDSLVQKLIVNTIIRSPISCSFHDSKFLSADFCGSGWAIVAGFDRADFSKELKLDTAVVGYGTDKYFKDFILVPILQKFPLTPLKDRWKVPKAAQNALVNSREAALLRLEGAAIVLKKHYKELWHEELSNRFYRFELWARENSPSAKGRLISKCYRWLSDYGYDLWRPVMWIGVLCAFLSLAYYGLYLDGAGRGISIRFGAGFDPKIWDAISFSWGRIAPIIPWESKEQIMAKDAVPVILHGPGLVGLTAHIIAITQTFLSTGLIFLFGLAARRRFRIAD